MDEAQLQAYFEQLGEKKFRASQLYQWLHQKLVTDFEQMTNLPESLRKTLKENCRLTALTAERVQVSQIDGTSKYLFKLYDGNLIESVLMNITTAIPCVFLRRWAAAWAAASVHRHWTAWCVIWHRRKC